MAWLEVYDTDTADFIAETKKEARRAGGAKAINSEQKATLAKLSKETGINSFPTDSPEYASFCIEIISARQRRIEHERRTRPPTQFPAFPIASTRL